MIGSAVGIVSLKTQIVLVEGLSRIAKEAASWVNLKGSNDRGALLLLRAYIEQAMDLAHYEIIDQEEAPYYGEIPGLQGAIWSAKLLRNAGPILRTPRMSVLLVGHGSIMKFRR